MPTVDESDFPAPLWSIDEPRIAGATDVGVMRTVNQDAFGRFDDAARGEILLVVADGLGGHRGGEVASQMAVERLGRAVFDGVEDPATRLRAAIEQTNEMIYTVARDDTSLDGMGTTVVCLLLAEDGGAHVAHVGDSRLYRLRAGRIEPLTEDHSLVATLVREGVLTEQDARTDPRRNQILLALGVRPDTEIEVAAVELAPGDVFLLCSDGLHGLLDDAQILALAHRPISSEPSEPSEAPGAVVRQLIDAANEAGGTDNVTVMLAQLPDPTAAARSSRQWPGGKESPIGQKRPGGKIRSLATRWLESTRARLPMGGGSSGRAPGSLGPEPLPGATPDDAER